MNNPDAPGAFEPADVPHALAQIARLGEVLEAEFDLVARMSWLVVPLVGRFLAACVSVALFAAVSAVRTLNRQRDPMMAGLPPQLRIDLFSANSRQEWWGNVPAFVIPPVLLLTWATASADWWW